VEISLSDEAHEWNDHKFKITHHAVFMQRRIRTYKIDFSGVSHFMDDFIEKQIDAMIGFKS
jgi:hypothetical protein